ncbi:MAG: RNB domain-containing ribonuclease [Exilispira sp.]|jgi:ribonuclease R|nr:RNB domain-containing ribonuclease [Exilispira sp.]
MKNEHLIEDLMYPDPDFIKIISKYGINIEFGEEVKKEIEVLQDFKIPEIEFNKRKDLRTLFTITMDSINAKDFDDAYSLKYENNLWTLWVHIADVSYFVKKDSHLDKIAQKRGNSYYLGPNVVHMLPPILSENLCSLKENEDRLAVTCEMQLDENGSIIRYDIYRSIINVKARIPYEIGNQILNETKDERDEKYSFLLLSQKLQKILFDNRINDGSLNFDFPDYIYFFKDDYIIPFDIIRYERGICERIIEEFMLCANKVIATAGSKLSSFIYRIHDKPDEVSSRQKDLEISNKLTHKKINEILKTFKNTDKQFAVETMILKSLKRANYDNKNIGHFGLNFEKYTHFTSPIRRYSDLVTHRLVLGEKYDTKELKQISILTSITEQIANSAEEEYSKIKNAHFLKRYLKSLFKVSVVGVIPKGVFCRIEKYGCEGLLSFKELKEKGYTYNKKLNIFENVRTKKVIKIGTNLELFLIRSDPKNGFIDFGFNNDTNKKMKTDKGKRKNGKKNQKKRRHSSRYDTSY